MADSIHSKRLPCLAAVAVLALAFIAAASGCSELINPSVTIAGVKYPPDTESITLAAYDSDDYAPFARLKNLRTLDVTALELSAEDYSHIRSQLDGSVDIIWSVPMSNGRIAAEMAGASRERVATSSSATAI